MKQVKPERLNREFACPSCWGFLAVYGNKSNNEWICIDCNQVFTRERLEKGGLKIMLVGVDDE